MKRWLALCLVCVMCWIPMAQTFVFAEEDIPAAQESVETQPEEPSGTVTAQEPSPEPTDPPPLEPTASPTQAPEEPEESTQEPTEEPTLEHAPEATAEASPEPAPLAEIPALENDLLPAGYEEHVRDIAIGETQITLGAGYTFLRLTMEEAAKVRISLLGDVAARIYLFDAADAPAIGKAEPGSAISCALEADKQYIIALAKAGEESVQATLSVSAEPQEPAAASLMSMLRADAVAIATMTIEVSAGGGVVETDEYGFREITDTQTGAMNPVPVTGVVSNGKSYIVSSNTIFKLYARMNPNYRFIKWEVKKDGVPVADPLGELRNPVFSTAFFKGTSAAFNVNAVFGEMDIPELKKGAVDIYVDAYRVTKHSIMLSWDKLNGVSGYELEVEPRVMGATGPLPVDEDGSATYETLVQGMDLNQTYTFTLRGYYVEDYGTASTEDDDKYYTAASTQTHSIGWKSNKMTLTAKSDDYNSISLAWTEMPYAEGYRLERKAPAEAKYKVLGTFGDSTFEFVDNTPQVDVTYTYRVVALNEVLSPTTGTAIDKNPPSASVTGKTLATPKLSLSCQVMSFNSVLLAWNDVPNIAGDYEVWRYDSVGKSWGSAPQATVSAGVPAYLDDDLVPGVKYSYYVRAKIAVNVASGAGTREVKSATVSATPDWKKTTLKAAAASYDQIKLTWTAIPDAEEYWIYRATDSAMRYIDLAVPHARVPATGLATYTFYDKDQVVSGKTYYYRIAPYAAGYDPISRVLSNKVSFKAGWPKVALKATVQGPESILLTWTEIPDQTFTITRSLSSKFLADPKYETTVIADNEAWDAAGYMDDGLSTGKKYYYKITLTDALLLIKPPSATASATPVFPTLSLTINVDPVTKKALSPAPDKGLTNILNWKAVPGVSGYVIKWGTSSKSLTNTITINDWTQTEYEHSQLPSGYLLDYQYTYYYAIYPFISANNVTVNGKQSAVKSRKPVWFPVTLTAAAFGYQGVQLSWTSKKNATDVEHYDDADNMYELVRVGDYPVVFKGAALSATDEVLTASASYRVRPIIIKDGKENYGPWSAAKTVKPAWGTTTLEIVDSFVDSITLRWNAQPYTTRYRIERALSASGPWESIMVNANPSGDPATFVSGSKQIFIDQPLADYPAGYDPDEIFDTPLKPNTTYYYRVLAMYGDVNAPKYSATKSAKTLLSSPILNKVLVGDGDYQGCTFTWDSVPKADGYEVFRSTSANGIYASIKVLSLPGEVANVQRSFTDSGLNTGATYYYKVRSYYNIQSGAKSYSALSAAISYQPTLGAIPAGTLEHSRESATTYLTVVKLTWPKVPGATGYEIAYAAGTSKTYSAVGTTQAAGDPESFRHYRVMPSTSVVKYRVRAYRVVNGKNVYGPYTDSVSTD